MDRKRLREAAKKHVGKRVKLPRTKPQPTEEEVITKQLQDWREEHVRTK